MKFINLKTFSGLLTSSQIILIMRKLGEDKKQQTSAFVGLCGEEQTKHSRISKT